jgi:hypothetical protein
MVVWPKVYMTESFIRKMVIWQNVFFRKSFWQKVKQPGGDEEVGHMYYSNEIWTVGHMTNFRKRQFFKKKKNKYIRSNDLSFKWPFDQITFRSNDHIQKTTFGQMNFRSNESLIKRTCAQFFSVNWHYLSKVDSVKWPFSLKVHFKMNFRSNGVRFNGNSVEWTFGHGVGSNGLSVKIFRWYDFSVKWSRTSFPHVKPTL